MGRKEEPFHRAHASDITFSRPLDPFAFTENTAVHSSVLVVFVFRGNISIVKFPAGEEDVGEELSEDVEVDVGEELFERRRRELRLEPTPVTSSFLSTRTVTTSDAAAAEKGLAVWPY
jgi:hypothetical protein